MLVLNRRAGESIYIGEDIVVTVLAIIGGQVRLGIQAPDQLVIDREEIYLRKKGLAPRWQPPSERPRRSRRRRRWE